MSRRTKVTGTRSFTLWLLIFIAVVLVVGVAAGGLFILPQIQSQQDLEKHYQAGVAFQNVGDWDKAAGEYEQVIVIDANYQDVQMRLAEVRAKLAEREATATAMAVAQAEQAQMEAQATATAQAQTTVEAQAHAKATATAQAEQAQAEAQATATAQAQATAEAQTKAQATAAAAPTATAEALEAHYQKGLGYMNIGRREEAKAELEQVFEVDPNYKEVQAKLAEVEVEIAKLTPTATPTSLATSTPPATATPSIITLKPQAASSFQNEGTTSTDDTVLLEDKDGYWAPSLTGSVTYDYFANGIGAGYFDALSLTFDIGERDYQNCRVVLRAFVQKGSYDGHKGDLWNHYLPLPGKQNPDYQDSIPFDVPNAQVIDHSTGKWVEIELSPKFWSEGAIWVTLRLWNVRVDAVELVLSPK